MMTQRNLWLLVLALAVWLLLTYATDSVNPIDQLQSVLNYSEDLMSQRLTHATHDASGNVIETPQALADAASTTLGEPVGVDEYAAARMLANESTPSRSDDDRIARMWVLINDAAATTGGNLLQCATGGNGFGPQGSRKYATGRNDPTVAHLVLVRACLSGQTPDPTGGAKHFLDRYGFSSADDYQAVVAKWSAAGMSRVTLDPDPGHGFEVWT